MNVTLHLTDQVQETRGDAGSEEPDEDDPPFIVMLKVGEGKPEHIEAAKDADEAFPDFVFECLDEEDKSADDACNAQYRGEDGQENIHGGSLAVCELGIGVYVSWNLRLGQNHIGKLVCDNLVTHSIRMVELRHVGFEGFASLQKISESRIGVNQGHVIELGELPNHVGSLGERIVRTLHLRGRIRRWGEQDDLCISFKGT